MKKTGKKHKNEKKKRLTKLQIKVIFTKIPLLSADFLNHNPDFLG